MIEQINEIKMKVESTENKENDKRGDVVSNF